MIALIPENLDLLEIKKKSSPYRSIKKYDEEFMIYLISLISEEKYKDNSKKKSSIDGVYLYSRLLRKKKFNYNKYIDYLLENKVFQLVQFPTKHKSARYRFTKPFQNQLLSEVQISDDYYKRVEYDWEEPDESDKDSKSTESSRQVSNAHLKQIEWSKNVSVNDEAFIELNKIEDKDKINYLHILLTKLNNMNESIGENLFKRDTTSYRLSSPIVRLNREYRKFLRYNGKNLGQVDLKNSQPFFLLKLMDKSFWSEENHVVRDFVDYNISKSSKGSLISYKEIQRTINKIDLQEKKKYAKLVSDGKLYNYLVRVANKKYSKKFTGQVDKDFIKELIFFILFANSRFNRFEEIERIPNTLGANVYYRYLPKQIFGDEFPTIYNLIKTIKRGEKSERLAIILQSVESFCILDIICNKLVTERSQIPHFTIHDSIVSLPKHLNLIKSITTNEIEKYVGYKPSLTKEIWN